jgi:hypothetical protein
MTILSSDRHLLTSSMQLQLRIQTSKPEKKVVDTCSLKYSTGSIQSSGHNESSRCQCPTTASIYLRWSPFWRGRSKATSQRDTAPETNSASNPSQNRGDKTTQNHIKVHKIRKTSFRDQQLSLRIREEQLKSKHTGNLIKQKKYNDAGNLSNKRNLETTKQDKTKRNQKSKQNRTKQNNKSRISKNKNKNNA